jgi:segregation and condensation protein B
MDYFGINSAADLPKLKEVFAETLVEPTIITHGTTETVPDDNETSQEPGDSTPEGNAPDGNAPLVITEEGELLEGHPAAAAEFPEDPDAAENPEGPGFPEDPDAPEESPDHPAQH